MSSPWRDEHFEQLCSKIFHIFYTEATTEKNKIN